VIAFDVGWGTTLAIKAVIVLAIVPLTALILGYVFLLKMMSHMQSRLGPMDPGGFHGWFQLIGDGVKFMQKEDIMTKEADRRVFALAPAVVVLSTFLVFVVIPAGPRLVVAPLDVGIFYALAVSSLSVIGVLMAGWASANKFALLGALRAAAQLIAYELPLVLAAAAVVMQAGTMSLLGIANAQWDHWFVLFQPIGFVIFMMATVAELTRPPFDMPVADSEIIFGAYTEYTGLKFAFFLLAEYGGIVVMSGIAATLYLGGFQALAGLTFIPAPLWMMGKIFALAFVIVWLRATFPRLREDQLQRFTWLLLTPLALLQILGVAVIKVATR
jgi:NADH-quinone oxidoreductase subunit H